MKMLRSRLWAVQAARKNPKEWEESLNTFYLHRRVRGFQTNVKTFIKTDDTKMVQSSRM
jgi:hypothetical protein